MRNNKKRTIKQEDKISKIENIGLSTFLDKVLMCESRDRRIKLNVAAPWLTNKMPKNSEMTSFFQGVNSTRTYKFAKSSWEKIFFALRLITTRTQYFYNSEAKLESGSKLTCCAKKL